MSHSLYISQHLAECLVHRGPRSVIVEYIEQRKAE